MRCCNFVLIFFVLLASGSTFADNVKWSLIGESGLGASQIYVDKNSLKTDSKGHVHVTVLEDSWATQKGIDRYTPDGEQYYDTSLNPTSSITEYVIDCKKNLEVFLRTRYFEHGMGKGEVIFVDKEAELFWTNILYTTEKSLMNYVCGKP